MSGFRKERASTTRPAATPMPSGACSERSEAVTLVVGHELAIRYIVDTAAGVDDLGVSEMRIANAMPYFFDEAALRNAAERLDAFASPASRGETPTEVAD